MADRGPRLGINAKPPMDPTKWGPPEPGEWQCPRCRCIYAGDGSTRRDGICMPCAEGFHEHIVQALHEQLAEQADQGGNAT